MKSILISGGNSGIGLQAAREFVRMGHRVVILGKDRRKCEDAVASLDKSGKLASFFVVDLSTHSGVRLAAHNVLTENDRFEAILHTTGVLTSRDIRTADGLNLSFAVNYLSRYHLTQLLLPALRRSGSARIVMMTTAVPVAAVSDRQLFRDFRPLDPGRMRRQTQVANLHYAAYLTRAEPGLLSGVVNAGVAKTDIYRHSPWYVRGIVAAASPLLLNSLQESAHNAVQACVRDDWPTGTYWQKPGAFERQSAITFNETAIGHVMQVSKDLTECDGVALIAANAKHCADQHGKRHNGFGPSLSQVTPA